MGKHISRCITSYHRSSADILWLPIVLGTVIGVVCLSLIIILAIFIVRKCSRHRGSEGDPTQSETIINYSPTFSKRQMFWQKRNPTMPDESHDWSIMRNFAKRNVTSQDDMLHRHTDRE
ncbi:hypothetical protein NP493_1002g01045 [Ridgeia piscesae]|uniref:Uncharacterized protein n=1 Tax=Ridgeia piscesae TaxID=27915 RepID=A0AAD9NKL1_RIDPI|nr:hypothetical protein NP493_1002g01045 [Ridgeia piscesae]